MTYEKFAEEYIVFVDWGKPYRLKHPYYNLSSLHLLLQKLGIAFFANFHLFHTTKDKPILIARFEEGLYSAKIDKSNSVYYASTFDKVDSSFLDQYVDERLQILTDVTKELNALQELRNLSIPS